MKIIKLYSLVFFLSLSIFTPFASAVFHNNGYDFSETYNEIHLAFNFEFPIIVTNYENGTPIQSISLQDLSVTNKKGEPIIPKKPIRILLPYGRTLHNISIELIGDPIIFDDIHPVIGTSLIPISHSTKETSIVISEKTIINQNKITYFNSIQNFKGFSILFLTIQPLIYDEVMQHLIFYPEIKIHINTIDGTPSDVIRAYPEDVNYITSIVENPSFVNSYPIPIQEQQSTESSYIIITNERLANSEVDYNFQTLIEYKIMKGLSASIFTVENIVNNPSFSVNGTWGDNNPSNPFYQYPITSNYYRFDDTAARIRNFIRYAYVELGTEYVLLGGDGDVGVEVENIIPARGLFANESGLPLYNQINMIDEEEDDIPSDVYYACLDGNFNQDMDEHFGESPDRNDIEEQDEADLMAEVYVGRACVDSDQEVSNFVSKTLSYENSHHPYLSKILFVGEYLGFPGISAYGGNYKDVMIPLVPDLYNLVTLYDRDLPYKWNKLDIIDTINNATPHIINHDGHSYYGYNLKMHNSDVDLLTNTNTFFLYSHGCMAGGFDNPSGYDCIAERLTVETPFGAFAAIMNSRYGLGSENNLNSPSLALDESFFKALFTENIREIGRANHYSKEDNIWQINENGIRWVFYETNLFGDPELAIKNPNQDPVELHINITRPENKGILYFKNTPLIPLPFISYPIIFGQFSIEVEAKSNPEGNVYSVEFLLDNTSHYIDTKEPFSWNFNLPIKGKHTLSVIAKGYYGESIREDRLLYIRIK